MLQQCCDAAGADLFISTYYTVPLTTPSVFMAHDMIPENTPFFDLNHPIWQVKHHGIRHASAFIAVSRNTALDLIRFHPPAANSMTIAHNGIDTSQFYPSSATDIDQFRKQHSIDKPYFLYIGDRTAYKKRLALFRRTCCSPEQKRL